MFCDNYKIRVHKLGIVPHLNYYVLILENVICKFSVWIISMCLKSMYMILRFLYVYARFEAFTAFAVAITSECAVL